MVTDIKVQLLMEMYPT